MKSIAYTRPLQDCSSFAQWNRGFLRILEHLPEVARVDIVCSDEGQGFSLAEKLQAVDSVLK